MSSTPKPTAPIPGGRFNDGSSFEAQTAEVLRLYSGALLERQKKLLGKKLDIYCTVTTSLMPPFRMAVECKDWSRPLTRLQVSTILAEYQPLLEQGLIDQFLLVTRNGIVPDAHPLADGRRINHSTLADLADKVLDPTPLVDYMVRQYSDEGLNLYYIDQFAELPNLRMASKYYDLLYNDFIDAAIERPLYDHDDSRQPSLKRCKERWIQEAGSELSDLTSQYSPELFALLFSARATPEVHSLESTVTEWLQDESIREGLALLGSYGTGKSSFARRIAFTTAQAYRTNRSLRIPFLIELKEFGSHQDIRGLVTNELVNHYGVANGSFEVFQSLNRAGRFFIILDGFDEMKEGMTSDALIFNFHQISRLFTERTKILLCGRPTLFESYSEQSKILKGEFALDHSASARYIQLAIAPFKVEQVSEFLVKYAAAKYKPYADRVRRFASNLEVEARTNSSLRSLVTRPVHLPMLVALLPKGELEPRSLNRPDLYREFIETIINREMLKRSAEFRATYPVQARKEFAKVLAVEMLRKGMTRSIRFSEIPDNLFDKFVRPGVPKEAVRRALVSACFLEGKAPDILFFPHKSFLEFLCAEYVIDRMGDQSPRTGGLKIHASPEMAAFIKEMASPAAWQNVARHPNENGSLLRLWIDSLRGTAERIPQDILLIWRDALSEMPATLRIGLADYFEFSYSIPVGVSREVLNQLVSDRSDVVSVHAYRTYERLVEHIDIRDLLSRIGPIRFAEWVEMEWAQFEPFELKIAKDQLLSMIAGMILFVAKNPQNKDSNPGRRISTR